MKWDICSYEESCPAQVGVLRGVGVGGASYIVRSHMPTRGAIYSEINWHVFLVGFSILFVCACVCVALTVGWWGRRTTTSAHTVAVHS